jgi:hypothetical protein
MTAAMKVLLGLLLSSQLLACIHSKPAAEPQPESKTVNQMDGISGVVHEQPSPQGLYWQLRYEDAEGPHLLIPIDLPEEFQKDGLKVVFKFHLSRIQQLPDQAGQPCVLEDIRHQ